MQVKIEMFSNKIQNFRQLNNVNRYNQVRKISKTLISRKEHKLSSISSWQNIFEESTEKASRPERDSSKTCEFLFPTLKIMDTKYNIRF